MKVSEHDTSGLEIALQVVDKVNKALVSAHRVFTQGHDVVLSERKGNLILLNGSPDTCIPLLAVAGAYELGVWIRMGTGCGVCLGGAEGGSLFVRPLPAL